MNFKHIFAKDHLRQIIEVLAIVTGISGLTLSNLQQSYPVLFYGALVLLILLSLFVLFSWRDENRLEKKDDINKLWQQLVSGASESVRVFAGDISWINRDEDSFKHLTSEDKKIFVLCRRPNNEVVQANMRKLIQSGAKVRYFDAEITPVIRGLIIDSGNPNACTAFTVSKKAKKIIDRKYGVPGNEDLYDYLGIRHRPPEDIEQIRTLAQLFDRTWDQSIRGFVLTPLNLELNCIAMLLSGVDQYSGIGESDLSYANLSIGDLWTTCSIVKDYKRDAILALLDAFETQHIHSFETVICESDYRKSILLPPLVERHGDKLVVIDGTHRLYFRHTFLNQSDAQCIVVSCSSPLPASPLQFSQVKLAPRKLPRRQSFSSYKPEFFRDISLLDIKLESEYDNLVA